ncbi:MAG: hypothetical protein Q9209_001753 [Squamulea sp. 1 TL-2023]
MDDNIDQILDKAVLPVANFRPNIILVHAGTNDLNMDPPVDPDQAPDRLGELIDNLISFGNKESVILVAQIIDASNGQTQSRIQKYNDAIPDIVAKRSVNHHVAVVDFRGKLQASDYADGLHPNDIGYKKMADVWFNAIQVAAEKGWIKTPQGPPPNLVGPDGLAKKSGSYCLTPPIWVPAINSNAGPIATGVGENGAMKWTAHYDPHWPKAASGIGKPGNGTIVNEGTGSVILYLNTGVGDVISWNPVNEGREIASGVAPRELIRFADIDQDGKDDYVVIGKDTGSVTVYLNRGPKAGAPGNWVWDGPHNVAPGAPGAKAANVLFADINGDGRPDYLVKNSNGGLDAYLNIGKPKTIDGIQWKPAGHIAQGFGSDDISMADINGDGRADYLQWGSDNKGSLTGYLNYRTEKEGQPGWASTGGIDSVAGGTGRSSEWTRLADFNGDGKADYAVVGDSGELDVYINKGKADTSVIGDSVRLADLNGDGLDDYTVLGPNAAVRLYVNGAEKSDHMSWVWIPINDFKDIATGAGAQRDMIHFADMDGDGKQDFNIVDPKSGSIVLYKNEGEQPGGKWGWTPVLGGKPIATGLEPGKLVRLADLDGDGKADYILLGAERGDAILYLNKGEKGGGWTWIPYNDGKPIATGIGFIADHVQFKDIDGDGKADYMGIDQLSGATTVYRNTGPQPNGGWGWVPMNEGKPIATGIGSVGRDVLWGRLEKTNRAYLNGCNEFTPPVDSSGGPAGSGQGGSISGGTGTTSGSGSGSENPNTGSSGGSDNPPSSGSSGGSGNPGGGSGNGGSGSDSGGSGGVPGSASSTEDGYINGGLLIPAGGLAAAGLATKGMPAISGLTPYAITAQNDLTTSKNAVDGLKAGNPTAAGVDAVVGALTILASDYAALSDQAKKWDIDSFDEGFRSGARKEQSDLESARKLVSDLIPKLKACSISSGKRQLSNCRQTYDQATTILSGDNLSAPLSWLGSRGSIANGGNGGSGSSTGSGPSSSSESGGDSGGGGGGGAPGGLSILGGGLPFPSSGLSSLGLPTAGAAAFSALKPYAITVQNALVTASNLASSLGGSSTSSQISNAENALDIASSELTAFSAQADAFELGSVSNSQAAAVQTVQSTLRNGAKTVSGLSSKLRGSRNTLKFGQTALLVGAEAVGGLLFAALYEYIRLDGPLSPKPAPPLPVPVSDSEPSDWYLNTVPGTSVKAFQEWIKGLPDKGTGRQHIYSGCNYQAYAGRWTMEEAEVINQDPIVDHQVPNVPLEHDWGFFKGDLPSVLETEVRKRVDSPTIITAPGSQRHLKILSLFKNLKIADFSDTNSLLDYAFERSAGSGTFVYVFDEFQGVPHEEYIVPTIRGRDGGPVTTIADQNNGHGTSVAAMVVGKTLGVAKRATVIGVKVSGDAGLYPEDVIEGWKWAVEDIRNKNREGKAVFVSTIAFVYPPALRANQHTDYAYRAPYNIPKPVFPDAWVAPLAEAWSTGVVTVFNGGNKGNPTGITVLGGSSPQRFAQPSNPMIIVGSISRTGAKSSFNLYAGPPSAGPGNPLVDINFIGEITTYAMADPVTLPDKRGNSRYTSADGTSYASPQVGGLAAYLLGLPNLQLPQDFRKIPIAMKNHIVRTSRDGSRDGLGVAYNGVRELPCTPVTVLRRSFEDAIFLEDKTYGLLGLNMTTPGLTLIQEEE